MIIKEIHIDGFGVFNNYTLSGLKSGINIIEGRNEAGKSTLLKFLRYTLFGYPHFRADHMLPVNGGNHGGRIKAILSSDNEVTFERMGGKSIQLFFNNEVSQNESQWMQLLGNATKELYENVYAFTLDELINLDKLSGSGVEDRIFSVGMGLGNVSLADIEKTINDKVDGIYKIRGKKHRFSDILNNVKILNEKINSIKNNLADYKRLSEHVIHLEEITKNLSESLKQKKAELEKINNYLKCFDSFIDHKNSAKILSGLPSENHYPDNGIAELEKFLERQKNFEEKIIELESGTDKEKGINELEKHLENYSYNAALLEKNDQVKYLCENLAKYSENLSEKTSEELKINELKKSIEQDIKNNVDAGWSEEKIVSFNNINVHLSWLEGFKQKTNRLNEEKNKLEGRLSVINSKKKDINFKNVILFISAIFFIMALVLAIFEANYVWAGVFFLFALFLFISKNKFLLNDTDSAPKDEMNDLLKKESELKEEYKNYLDKKLGLSADLTIEGVFSVINTIKDLQDKIADSKRLAEKLEKQRIPFIKEFENKVVLLKDVLSEKTTDNNIEILLNRIMDEYDFALDQKQGKDRIMEELSRRKAEHERCKDQIQKNNIELNELLQSIDAGDVSEFREKYRINEEVKTHAQIQRKAMDTIEKIAGQNKSEEVIGFFNENEKEDVNAKQNELKIELEQIETEYAEKNKELGANKNRLENLEGESELFDLLTELETEKEKLQNAYKEWMSAKIALNILNEVKSVYEKEKQPEVITNSGRYFNRITDGQYEKVYVSLDSSNKDVSIYDSRGVTKNIDQLSRGTKEQLLVSLRLGFIDAYEKRSEPLPVIVDEVLVNFDPVRAVQAAKVLHEFSKNRQLILFTCHPSTRELFDGMDVNVRSV